MTVDQQMVYQKRLKKELPISRKEEGCAVVEMECAALAAVATSRVVGDNFYSQPTLHSTDLENYDNDWGFKKAFDKALELCLEIVSHM